METDVLVIGSGPAGIQAAIHASRRKVSVVVAGRPSASAAAGTEMDNYFGTGLVSGDRLIEEGIRQAESTGAVFSGQNVISSSRDGEAFRFVLEDGTEVVSKAVVIATGISRKKLGIPGEKELFGKGVSYCAVCDCNFYKGRRAVIVGNESEAATSAKPRAIVGETKVEALELEDGTTIPTDGVFIELGARSAADIAMDLDVMPEMDDTIKVGTDCATEVPGVYACGDVTGKPWQVAKAVGQGCVAGTNAAAFVKGER